MCSNRSLPIVNSLWIGDTLGPVHAACLRSFVSHGHHVVLHAFAKPTDTPAGVELFNAAQLMGKSEIVAHRKTGSLALASDLYRYRIQREGLGLYVDCDVFCVHPFIDREYILAQESNQLLNPAILKVPKDSALLKALLAAAEDPYFIPQWISKKRQFRYRMRKKLGFPCHVSQQPWGTIGPLLLTYLVEKLGLTKQVSPIDIYSPMHGGVSALLFEEGLRIQDLVTSRTLGLHLYNSGMPKKEIKPNTPIYEIIHS